MEQVLQAIETTKEQMWELLLLERDLAQNRGAKEGHAVAVKRYCELSMAIFGTVRQDHQSPQTLQASSIPLSTTTLS